MKPKQERRTQGSPKLAEQNWAIFHQLYAPLIYRLVLERTQAPPIAQTVLQETLVTFSRIMDEFDSIDKNQDFRTLLRNIVRSRLSDALRREFKQAGKEQGKAKEISVEIWERIWQDAWERQLLLEALKRLREREDTRVFEAFRRTTLEARPMEQVAAVLQTDAAGVTDAIKRITGAMPRAVEAVRKELGS